MDIIIRSTISLDTALPPTISTILMSILRFKSMYNMNACPAKA